MASCGGLLVDRGVRGCHVLVMLEALEVQVGIRLVEVNLYCRACL